MSISGENKNITASDIRVAYESGVEILRGVNFNARCGEVTAIIGPNGAGKSTLLRALAGLAPVRDGRIKVDDTDLTTSTPRMRLQHGVAFVPQERSCFPEMSVEENLRMGGWINRTRKDWLESRIQAICELFPLLAERLAEPAGSLSGGQQKILELARALIGEPSILLLDEPTAPLSPQMAEQVYCEIRKLNRQLGVTVVLVDQNIRQGLQVADYVYVLVMGKNNTEGTSADIRERLPRIVESWLGIKGSGVVQ